MKPKSKRVEVEKQTENPAKPKNRFLKCNAVMLLILKNDTHNTKPLAPIYNIIHRFFFFSSLDRCFFFFFPPHTIAQLMRFALYFYRHSASTHQMCSVFQFLGLRHLFGARSMSHTTLSGSAPVQKIVFIVSLILNEFTRRALTKINRNAKKTKNNIKNYFLNSKSN